jgi:adenylosuccinate synthase
LFDDDGQSLRDVGREYGSTTGRPRRCGWLDLPALRYAIMLNGVDELMMMKTDVLNSFEEIKVAVKYRKGNIETDELPTGGLEEVMPVYKSLKGWASELDGITDYDGFPDPVKNYVDFIEESVGVPVKIVSIGPDRTQTVVR